MQGEPRQDALAAEGLVSAASSYTTSQRQRMRHALGLELGAKWDSVLVQIEQAAQLFAFEWRMRQRSAKPPVRAAHAMRARKDLASVLAKLRRKEVRNSLLAHARRSSSIETASAWWGNAVTFDVYCDSGVELCNALAAAAEADRDRRTRLDPERDFSVQLMRVWITATDRHFGVKARCQEYFTAAFEPWRKRLSVEGLLKHAMTVAPPDRVHRRDRYY